MVSQAVGYNIQIVPEHPASCDVVVITLSGYWSSSCIPNDSAISVVGNDIYFDVIWNYPPGISCLTVITPWERIRFVGPLSPGTYTVYARIVGYPFIPETYVQVAQFVVSDKQFVLSTKSLTVPEGNTASFTVALMMDPCDTVEVTVAPQSGDPDITVEAGGTFFFDSSNYSTPQTVTLTAAEDDDYLNGQVVIRVSSPEYLTSEVIAIEGDNDIPSVLYVDADASGNNDGKSWKDAFIDLQEALSIAEQYPEIEEIRVAQGVYKPAGPSGNRNASFQLVDSLIIKGGYAGFGEPEPDARNLSSYKTILSGDLNRNDGPNFTNRSDNSFHILVVNKEGITATLDGFAVTAGNGGSGGGVYGHNGCDITFKNCIFEDNSAAYGGGVFNRSGHMTFTNCMFINNSASFDGGGIFNYGYLTLVNCSFGNNTAEKGEYGNGSGGGIWNYPYYTDIKLTNCIFWSNRDTSGANESAQIRGGNLFINYSCIQGWTGVLGGSGNLGADPLFTDPNNGDYHLSETSPCINTGDPNYVPEPNETDLDGKPRVIGGQIDMGAYEFNHQPIANAGTDQTVYAWIDGIADVNLDGLGSFDADNDPLTYKWSWTIDGNDYEANGVKPSIELPVGQYVISLIVNDGLIDSEPNEVNITVVGPIEANLCVMPKVLNCKSFMPRIMAMLRLPKGITKDQLDTNEPILLYPGEIEADWTWFSKDFDNKCRAWSTTIFASFDKDKLLNAIDDNGQVELVVVGRLKTGQYFFGSDDIRITCPPGWISPGNWPHHKPWCNHRWNRWCQKPCNFRH
jgi:hypothetical protein